MILIFAFLLLYFIFLLWNAAVWINYKDDLNSKEQKSVSVLVAFRNEEKCISELLESLLFQDYPLDKYEIILVDDHSADNSRRIIDRYKKSYANLSVYALSDNKTGKKAALTLGVEKSKNSIIITTDGDCIVPKTWVSTIVKAYDNCTVFTFGGVGYTNQNKLFQLFQESEQRALLSSSLLMHFYNKPGMCNGANLSFRKDVFFELGGYSGNEHISTGDDEFLLRKVKDAYPNGTKFIQSEKSWVSTKPPNSFKDLVDQKIRWASKWKLHNDIGAKLLGVFILLANIVFISIFLLTMFQILPTDQFAAIVIIKAILELLLIQFIPPDNRKFRNLFVLLIISIIYPFYAVSIGLMSLKGSYTWKGRPY